MSECTDHDRCIQRDNFKRNSLAVFDNAGTDLLDFISQPSFQVTRRDARAAVESMRRTNAALAAYIERLEAERDMLAVMGADFSQEQGGCSSPEDWITEAKRRLERVAALKNRLASACVNAERVIRGE